MTQQQPNPFKVEAIESGTIRLSWGDGPLDFINLDQDQAATLIERLCEVTNRRVEARW